MVGLCTPAYQVRVRALESIGERVARLREARGWSQTELSRQSGVLQSDISRLEAGKTKRASALTVERLARALGMTTDWLLTGECEPPILEEWMLPADDPHNWRRLWPQIAAWPRQNQRVLRDQLASEGVLITVRPKVRPDNGDDADCPDVRLVG